MHKTFKTIDILGDDGSPLTLCKQKFVPDVSISSTQIMIEVRKYLF